MASSDSWDNPISLAQVQSTDLARPGVVFRCGHHVYRTTGKQLGHGGMGHVFLLDRRRAGTDEQKQAVGKVFLPEFLYQVRTDEVTRTDHEAVLKNVDRIATLDHPNLLPLFASAPIRNNHLTITPLMRESLRQAIARGALGARKRIELFCQALEGLACLHDNGFIHRDVTLRNILVDDSLERTTLFDFDLTLAADDVEGQSYKSRYKGRIFGSPGYSVAPEILDAELMELPIDHRLDLYAVGGAIFNLFADDLPYGDSADMWALLMRISEGVVHRGNSHIRYDGRVPEPLRPIIEHCLERDPANRADSVREVISALRDRASEIEDRPGDALSTSQRTLRYGDRSARLSEVHRQRRDRTLTAVFIESVDQVLARHGYQVHRAIGRVKNHSVFLAAPDPELIIQGRFHDSNIYPKVVTVISLKNASEREQVLEDWNAKYVPILKTARQGLLTSLYRAVYDQASRYLLLFSEYVDDARFGTDIAEQDLTLAEALALGYLVIRQVMRLHEKNLAHNNICAASLLLKGSRDSRSVHPAMVGIVAPSLSGEDMARDVVRLSALILEWMKSSRPTSTKDRDQERLADVRDRLQRIANTQEGTSDASATGTPPSPPRIGPLLEIVADGLSSVDHNFGVLRESSGNLDDYTLLMVSHSLYGRLWR